MSDNQSRIYTVNMTDGSNMDVCTTGGTNRAMEVAEIVQADRDESVKAVSAAPTQIP
jgi:hypothetical protein